MTAATMRDHRLTIALQAAVPLLVMELKTMRESARLALIEDWRRPREAIYGRGDQLMYPTGKKKPRTREDDHGHTVNIPGSGSEGTAEAFAVLARAIAALSFHQGGVRLFGLQWCAEHSLSGEPTDTQMVCEWCAEQYPQAPKGCPCCAHLVAERVTDVDTGGLT